MNAHTNPPADPRELVLTRIIDAPPSAVYKAWTTPELMKQFFAPKPWTTPHVDIDVRAGGANRITMRSPEGQDFPNEGVYLEVIPNKKLVFTDAYGANWKPSEKPFFTAVLTFDETPDGKTKYTARALHWNTEDAETHAKMGFHDGWGQVVDQLEALLKSQK